MRGDRRFSILWVILALYILFFILFSGLLPEQSGFWALMSGGISGITLICLYLDPRLGTDVRADLRSAIGLKILLGLGTALILYGVFYTGEFVLSAVLPHSVPYIDSVYSLRTGRSSIVLILLLACVIGPGEELTWRAFVQRNLTRGLGPRVALTLSVMMYTCAHIPSGNPMLILAAFICGLSWTMTYHLSGSIIINIVSHSVWDVMVFVLFPF